MKLEAFLNEHAAQGGGFVTSMHETKKILGLFAREAPVVIFGRDV